MPAVAGLLGLTLCCVSTAFSITTELQGVPAVQKVILLLTDLAAKASQDKSKEEVAFEAFSEWCKLESASTKKDITRGEEVIELVMAEIEKLAEEAGDLANTIRKLQNNMASFKADQSVATKQRQKDHAQFLTESAEYSEASAALDDAIVTLQQQQNDRTGEALVQVSKQARVPIKARNLIVAFLGMMKKDQKMSEPPDEKMYSFQSGGIIDMLAKLRDDFAEKLGACQKEEVNSKNAFDLTMQGLGDSIENIKKDIEEKTIEKEKKTEKAAANKKKAAAKVAETAADKSALEELQTECREKSVSFQEKTQLRDEEIEAIMKAVQLLESRADGSKKASKQLGLHQAEKARVVLLQVQLHRDASIAQSEGIRHRLRQFIASEAARLHSRKLESLAQKISSDPFTKVKQIIDSMITRLMEESSADADHEAFCGAELGKSKITRLKLTQEIDVLTSAVEDGKASIMMLAKNSKILSQEIAELESLIKDATQARSAESARNQAMIEDAKNAHAAVLAASEILKNFYKKSAVMALDQFGSPRPRVGLVTLAHGVPIPMGTNEWEALANPNFRNGTRAKGQTFGKVFTGHQDEANGAMALLEIITSDFEGLKADTDAAETIAQNAFLNLMRATKQSVAVKSRGVSRSNTEKTAAEAKLQEDTADLKSTESQLVAADRYHSELVPQCVNTGMSHEQVVQSRQQELTSLKKALKILGGEEE